MNSARAYLKTFKENSIALTSTNIILNPILLKIYTFSMIVRNYMSRFQYVTLVGIGPDWHVKCVPEMRQNQHQVTPPTAQLTHHVME